LSTTKAIIVSGVGEVVISKNKLASRLSIRVKPDGEVIATIPWRASFAEAETFVLQKKDWIKTALEKTKKNKKIYDKNVKNITLFHDLELVPHDRSQVVLSVANKTIKVFYPAHVVPSDDTVQKAVHKGLHFVMKHEAKKYLHFRINCLAEEHGLQFKRLSIRDPRTRWGSCSSDNSISLSYQLMRLPEHLIDYVILHELAHTVHKNHGKGFWELLEKLTGNARAYSREMRNYTTML
jgi:predicted metal-dependent hydrolase